MGRVAAEYEEGAPSVDPSDSPVPSRAVARSPRASQATPSPLLTLAARTWFAVTVVGQLLFAAYISVLYGGGAARGDITVLATVMPKGYIPGDTIGNATIIVHLIFAAIIMVGGSLQLVPWIRQHAPKLHRFTGRSYIVSAMLASVGGLYLVWVRGTVGDNAQHIGSTLNATLILAFAVLAWRAARAKEFATHRRWALRLFMVASGVWFFRIGLMLWLLIYQRPVGFDMDSFTGPFLTALTFGESLLPLLVLEGYLWAHERAGTTGQRTMAVTLLVLTLGMAAGLFATTMGMWLPRM